MSPPALGGSIFEDHLHGQTLMDDLNASNRRYLIQAIVIDVDQGHCADVVPGHSPVCIVSVSVKSVNSTVAPDHSQVAVGHFAKLPNRHSISSIRNLRQLSGSQLGGITNAGCTHLFVVQ